MISENRKLNRTTVMNVMNRITFWIAVLCFTMTASAPTFSSAQQKRRSPVTTAPTANISQPVKDVIQMSQRKVDEDVIFAFINSHNGPFNLKASEIMQMQDAGVSKVVIQAMINHDASLEPKVESKAAKPPPLERPATAPAPKAPVMTNSNVDEVGLYYMENGRPIRLEPHTFAEQRGDFKGAVKRLFTLKGVGTDIKGVLDTPKASARTKSTKPEFVFYVPEGASQAEYTLVRLDSKKAHREITIAKILPHVGQGVRTKAQFPKERVVKFSAVRLSARKYQITIESSLEPGEYAFCPRAQTQYSVGGVTNNGTPVYDFGVD